MIITVGTFLNIPVPGRPGLRRAACPFRHHDAHDRFAEQASSGAPAVGQSRRRRRSLSCNLVGRFSANVKASRPSRPPGTDKIQLKRSILTVQPGQPVKSASLRSCTSPGGDRGNISRVVFMTMRRSGLSPAGQAGGANGPTASARPPCALPPIGDLRRWTAARYDNGQKRRRDTRTMPTTSPRSSPTDAGSG